MTDRELLELAAKAVRLKIVRWGEADYNSHLYGEVAYICAMEANDPWGNEWNPLSDDGDAFCLAVKLKLPIEFPTDSPYGPDRVAVNIGLGIVESMTPGPCAATRRAIVRAASEVGKGMV